MSDLKVEIQEILYKFYNCALTHSRMPERQDDGTIKWVCKEGRREKENGQNTTQN